MWDIIFKQVRDSKITSFQSKRSRKRKDVTISWNEPRAASFIGHHVPTEHLMYILEIDPPIDKHPEEDITLMPACNVCLIIGTNIIHWSIKVKPVPTQFDFDNDYFLF